MNAHATASLDIPTCIPTEQALLGAVLLNPDAYYRTCDLVEAECFFEELHGQLWDMIGAMLAAGKKVDPVQVVAMLGKDAKVAITEGMTIAKYVAALAAEATTVVNAPDYAKTVRD